ncbi:uncharacterized protein LOC113359264 [Papaver somniferum]|uniref:uncharacterized protein LOC113359264 n=1 Tax=Papaver somniferum TaxID=3469 RepID=UPI000E6F603F|nr:uncharacterized protein LOC113359264 [Papaver somniferum]
MYNTIHTIRDHQGNWIDNKDQVVDLLSRHFKKIYTSSNPSVQEIHDSLRFVTPLINEDMNENLTAIPSVQEIWDTVNMMAPWSSPGPDGFPPGFFKDNWDTVKEDVVSHVQNSLISPFQSAFVANRQIHDNIVITHEILHSFKSKKKKSKNYYMAIKLDLSKSFDRLEWSFIIAVFKKFGFSDDCCQLVFQYIITVSYSVLVNGSPNDCMLFCKASVTYVKNIIKVINVFAKALGQAINFDKSGFITSGNMHHRHIKILSKALNMKFLSSSEKYLGTPLFIGKDKTKSFSFLIDNLYTRLNSTKKSNLNIAGRTVVTKHVLSSLSVYHMACFTLPKTVTSKIDSIQRTFWWAKKNPKHAAYFRSWGDIGKSKLNEGLGLRNSFATNRVFICKLGWRILKNQDSLLSRFLKDKYFPNQNLLEIDKVVDSASWMWKGIVLPHSPMNTACNEFVYVSELIDYNYNYWNVPLLNLLFSPDEVIRIKSIRLNLSQSDSLMWAHTRNGKFTIKSAYRIYMNDIPSPENSTIWRKVWDIDCLPKVKFFMWKMFAHMLSVNAIMQLYNPHVNVLCSFCNSHDETVMHLFVNRPVVLRIWFSLSLQHLISTDLDWVDDIFLYWHESSLGASPFKVGWPSVGAIVMWSIWKLRCDVVFKSASLYMNKIIVDIKRMLNSYITPRITVLNLVHNVKIPQSKVENFMFVDGSFKDFNFGICVIWCDTAGNVRKVC